MPISCLTQHTPLSSLGMALNDLTKAQCSKVLPSGACISRHSQVDAAAKGKRKAFMDHSQHPTSLLELLWRLTLGIFTMLYKKDKQ